MSAVADSLPLIGRPPGTPRRVVEVAGLDGHRRRFGGGAHIFVVGPDSPQTMEQTLAIAKMAGAIADRFDIRDRVMLRGGAFKPRTRPTDWRGLGMQGIAMLDAAREETGLPYVTEIMDPALIDELAEHADMLQIGTRNAQNFDLLEVVGRAGRPVVLKRGFGNEADEWFHAAEYIAKEGNDAIVLCERGVKTLFSKGGYSRYQPDFNVIAHAQASTVLPVLFDPSHSAGAHERVVGNLMGAAAYQADGTMTETIHDEAFRATQLCDGAQALTMDRYARVVEAVLTYETQVRPLLPAELD